MHWKSWDHLTKSKDLGGLGFKDKEAFNLALLGKQLWRLITNKSSLLARIYKSRYYSKTDPLNAELGSRPSYAWRSIHSAQKLIKQGARSIIGNGRNTGIWTEQWLGAKPARAVRAINVLTEQQQQTLPVISKVSELLQNQGKEWNLQLLDSLFPEEEQQWIRRIRPCGEKSDDKYRWEYTKTGHYTVKSGYWVLQNILKGDEDRAQVLQPSLEPLFQMIWKLETSPKIKRFLWRCLSDSLPVAKSLAYRHISKDATCLRCAAGSESVNHVLFQCPYARLIWALSPIPAPPEGIATDSFYSNIHHVLSAQMKYPKEEIAMELVPWILWRLWKNRNEFQFKGRDYDAVSTLNKAREDAEDWKRGNEVEL